MTEEDDWDERWEMTKFLQQEGWMLSKAELIDIIKEYGLEDDYLEFQRE